MNGLAWLNDLMTWLARWVPRLQLIASTHEGVLFGPGGRVARRRPGLCWYWPITHSLQLVGTRLRSIEIAAQLHGGEVVSVVVSWIVVDAVRVVTAVNEPAAFLDDRIQAALAAAHASGLSNDDLCKSMLDRLHREFLVFGIEVHSVDVAQRSWVLPIKNLNDYANHADSAL